MGFYILVTASSTNTYYPMDWRVGFNKGLAAQPNFFVFKYFKTTSIDKSFGYKVIDLPKGIKFYTGYFLKKVVVVKA